LIIKEKYETEFLIRAVGFFLCYLEKYALLGGKIEKWIMINSLKGVGVMNIPVGVSS
jgi:hypothetical protein